MSIKSIIKNLNTSPKKKYRFENLSDEDILNMVNHKVPGETWTDNDIGELISRLNDQNKRLVKLKGIYGIHER